MSCRVAGKFVESALFAYLLEREKCRKGSFTVRKTKKNVLLRNTLEHVGFRGIAESGNDISYAFTNELVNKEIILVEGARP